jgi:lipopolysaccharide transport system ATP-binding protein
MRVRAAEGRPAPRTSAPAVQRVKVIKFSSVSKRFILHHERPRSFQEMVVNLFGLRAPSRRGVAMPAPVNEEFWALRDVNFGVYAGEAVGIIGENGSGKSTTLKLISRILEPTSGSVSVRGKVSALLELGTGFHPDLTGRENIFLNGSLLGVPRKEMQKRYESIVDFAELHEFKDTPIKHYSTGMVMR